MTRHLYDMTGTQQPLPWRCSEHIAVHYHQSRCQIVSKSPADRGVASIIHTQRPWARAARAAETWQTHEMEGRVSWWWQLGFARVPPLRVTCGPSFADVPVCVLLVEKSLPLENFEVVSWLDTTTIWHCQCLKIDIPTKELSYNMDKSI
jgi:hypothetical protein